MFGSQPRPAPMNAFPAPGNGSLNEGAPSPKTMSFGSTPIGMNSLPPNEEAPSPKSISFGPAPTGNRSGGSRRKKRSTRNRRNKRTRRH